VETPPASRKLTIAAKKCQSASVPSSSARSQIFTKKSEWTDLNRCRLMQQVLERGTVLVPVK
jgi:hypothetical protein